jgi:hypothetical protein
MRWRYREGGDVIGEMADWGWTLNANLRIYAVIINLPLSRMRQSHMRSYNLLWGTIKSTRFS